MGKRGENTGNTVAPKVGERGRWTHGATASTQESWLSGKTCRNQGRDRKAWPVIGELLEAQRGEFWDYKLQEDPVVGGGGGEAHYCEIHFRSWIRFA